MSMQKTNKVGMLNQKIYTLTESQLNEIKYNIAKSSNEEAFKKALDIAWQLMLAIPCEVLIGEGYWEKSAKKRMPKFVDDCLSLYESYTTGVLKLEDLRKDLKKYGGVELKVNDKVKKE